MELRDSQYQTALKFMRSADDALQQAISGAKNKKAGPRLARTLDEVTVTPPSRLGSESEVSCAVAFLLSPAATYVSGATLKVDGATSVYKNPMVPLGHHDPTPKWDGFHLHAKLAGLYAED